MELIYKEVDFWRYCETCEHKNKPGDKPPCDECLSEPKNVFSRKPVRYKKNK